VEGEADRTVRSGSSEEKMRDRQLSLGGRSSSVEEAGLSMTVEDTSERSEEGAGAVAGAAPRERRRRAGDSAGVEKKEAVGIVGVRAWEVER
jgi:hypothetical protein